MDPSQLDLTFKPEYTNKSTIFVAITDLNDYLESMKYMC